MVEEITCTFYGHYRKSCIGNAMHKRETDNLVGGSEWGLHKLAKISPQLNLKRWVGFQQRWGKLWEDIKDERKNKVQGRLKHSLGHATQSNLTFCAGHLQGSKRWWNECTRLWRAWSPNHIVQSLFYEKCRKNKHFAWFSSQSIMYNDTVLLPLLI